MDLRTFIGLQRQLSLFVGQRADPERKFLLAQGWVPFGKNSQTGLEGWGRMIEGKSVIVDQPEALRIARGEQRA